MSDWRDRLKKIIRDRGLNNKALSLAAGLGETAVRDMLDKTKVASPRLDTVVAVAEQLGMTLTELLEGQAAHGRRVPIIGYVAAGEGWYPFENDGPIDEAELTLPNGQAVGLVVRGDSMAPVYRDGDVLIGTKRSTTNAHNLIGTDCIIETQKGARYVKFLTTGTQRGKFNLRSYNPVHVDIENVDIAWAAPISMVIRNR